MKELKVQKVSVSKLIPAEYNPRKADPKMLELLKKSIQEDGYIEPIVWNERTGNIIAGHQRLKVMKDLGYEEIEVVVVDVDETKEKILNLRLNKQTGEWDFPILADLLQEIDTGNLDMDLTGFPEIELEKIALWNKPLPDDLEDVEIKGGQETTGNYLIVNFQDKAQYEQIRLDLDLGKSTRVVTFDALRTMIKNEV